MSSNDRYDGASADDDASDMTDSLYGAGFEHTVWDELAAGAALHALEPDEQHAFDLHAAACQTCRRTLDGHALIAAQLGSLSSSDEDEAPPTWASIRDRILADAEPTRLSPATDRSVLPAGFGKRSAAGLSATDGDTTDLTAEAGDDLQALRRRKAARLSRSRRLLAAAAAVVALTGGVTAWQIEQRGPGAGTTAGCAPTVLSCHEVELQSSKGTTVADIVVTNDSLQLSPTHLATAPSGKVYVLWQTGRSKKPVAIGSFTGASPVSTQLKLPYSATSVFAVSEENDGGLPRKPTNTVAAAAAS